MAIPIGTSFPVGVLANCRPIEPLDHMLLTLRRNTERQAALEQFIDALHDRNSPHFHQWLTATQFGQLYGPAQSDIDAVTTWLNENGFVVNEVAPSGLTIDFSGTARQVKAAFATAMQSYDVDGATYLSNATDPSIPAALAPVVVGVVSLNNSFKRPQMRRHTAPPLLAAASRPVSPRMGHSAKLAPYLPAFTYLDPNNSLTEDVAPGDFNVIYNINPVWSQGYRGAGQTVTVIERTKIKDADWTTFRTAFGLSGYAGTLTQTVPSGCTDPGMLNTGDQGEAALDAEWAGAAAPDANIVLFACKSVGSSDGIDLAVNKAVNSVPAPAIASVSYGSCESDMGTTENNQYNSWWQQAAAEGMTVFVSAGDEGAAGCDGDTRTSAPYGWATHGIAVSGLASTPYNVAVGGTDFRDEVDNTVSTYWNTTPSTPPYTSALSYVPEIPWNSSCAGSMLLAYRNANGGNYADSIAYCNTATGRNLVDVDAGSGGPSAVYTQPSWQSAVYGAPTANVRGLPDVSLFSASGFWGHALVFCMSDTRSGAGGTVCDYTNATDHYYNAAGGTSFAAPALAGIQALVNHATGQSWGNMNTQYYALAAQQYGSSGNPNSANLANCNADLGNAIGSTCVFNDVTSGDITVPCLKGSTNCYSNVTAASNSCGSGSASTSKICGILSTSTSSAQPAYAATGGWDFATGLGSVNVANLVAAMAPPAGATQLAFTQQPSASYASGATITVKVSVQDSSGAVVSGDTSAVTVALTTANGATLGGTKTVNAVNGVATFNNLTVDKAGTYTLKASDGALTAATSSAFTITAGAATKLVFTAQPPASSPANAAFGATVTIQDAAGNTVTGNTSTVTLALGGGTAGAVLSGTATVNAVNGVATFSGLSVDKIGTGYVLNASDGALTGAASSAFAITAGAASKLVFTAQPPASSSSGAAFGATVTIEDAAGNTVTGNSSTVTLALGGGTAGAALSGASAAAVNGVATFANLAVDKVGTGYALSASDGALSGATSNAFAIIAGAASKLVFTAQPPASSSSGAAFGATVTIEDAAGNTVSSDSSTVTLALGGGSAGAVLSGASAAAVNGVAMFPNLAVDRVGTGYVLNASDGALTGATSGAFAITVGAASQLAFVTQPANVAQGDRLGQVQVAIEDAGGNVISGDSTTQIALSTSACGSVALAQATVSAGIATFAAGSVQPFYTLASGETLEASGASLAGSGSAAFDVVANSDFVFADGFEACRP